MGYNLSRFSVSRNLPQLDLLLTATSDIRFETSQPAQLRAKILEALAASKEFEDLKHYHEEIKAKFTFKEEPDAVIAKYNLVSVGIPVGPVDVRDDSEPVRQTKGTVDSARQLLDVIGSGVEGDKEGYEEIYFPNVVLSKKDMKALWDWAETTAWGIVDSQEKGLTLTKSEEYKDFLWRPEEG